MLDNVQAKVASHILSNCWLITVCNSSLNLCVCSYILVTSAVFPFRMVQRILYEEAKCQGKRHWQLLLFSSFLSDSLSVFTVSLITLLSSTLNFSLSSSFHISDSLSSCLSLLWWCWRSGLFISDYTKRLKACKSILFFSVSSF